MNNDISFMFLYQCSVHVLLLEINNISIQQEIYYGTNLVYTYKIHYWTIFVLCVLFKCQYLWSYSRKTDFWPFIYIFQRTVTHSKIVRLTRFFLYSFRTFQLSFFCSLSLIISKNHEAKMTKKWISCWPFWIFAGHLGFTKRNF